MIAVLLADDHTLVREGLCRLLERAGGIAVQGQASNGGERCACWPSAPGTCWCWTCRCRAATAWT